MEQAAHAIEDNATDGQVALAQLSRRLFDTEPTRAERQHVAATRLRLIAVEVTLSTLSPRRPLVTEAVYNVRDLLAGLVADVGVVVEGAKERGAAGRDSAARLSLSQNRNIDTARSCIQDRAARHQVVPLREQDRIERLDEDAVERQLVDLGAGIRPKLVKAAEDRDRLALGEQARVSAAYVNLGELRYSPDRSHPSATRPARIAPEGCAEAR